MAITYTWNIKTVDRTIATGGINTIHWRCNAVDGDHSVGSYGSVGCTPDPSASDFIAYDSVTETNCIAWVQANVGKDNTEAALALQIATLKTPVTGSGTPW
jgi:hypothetical protein